MNHLDAKMRRSGIRIRGPTLESNSSSRYYPFVLICSSFFGSCFSVQQRQEDEHSGSSKAGASNVSTQKDLTYEIDSIKTEINTKLFAKADFFVDNFLSFSRIKLSYSQALILDGVQNGVLLSHFAQEVCRKNAEVPDNCFRLFDAAGLSPTLVVSQNAKAKERNGTGSLSKYKRQKLQRFYTQSGAAYVSVRNIVKACLLPVPMVRPFCIQSFRTQSVLFLRVSSAERRHLPDSKMKFGVLLWHTLIQ